MNLTTNKIIPTPKGLATTPIYSELHTVNCFYPTGKIFIQSVQKLKLVQFSAKNQNKNVANTEIYEKIE